MKALAILALIFVAVLGGISFIVYNAESYKCWRKYENYQPQYGFWTGCRIMVDGKLTPVGIVRVIK